MPMRRKVGAGLLLLALLGSAATVNLPFGSWSRASDGPILSPQGLGWESAGTFNPAVLLDDGKFIMLYRAQDTARSEEHTSELQSRGHLVCRLLLEKKNG